MRLIVGLGNPGDKYERTRHNVGFRAVRAFHTMHAMNFGAWKESMESELSEGKIHGDKTVLLLPQTFMNESGRAVTQALDYWNGTAEDVIVVSDDLDLPVGRIRVRPGGSSGGHKGMQSVIEHLGTMEFVRVRIGIAGETAARTPSEKYVLQRFSSDEETEVEKSLGEAIRALDSVIKRGVEETMNDFN